MTLTDPTDAALRDQTDATLRELLAEITGLAPAAVAGLSAQTPLLHGELGLSSVQGARLLTRVRDRFGVDVAAEDLSLRSLETIDTLVTFIHQRRPKSGTSD